MRIALLMVLVAVMLAASHSRNALWFNDGTIWADSVRKSGKARGYCELGLHLLETGNNEEATRILSRSLVLDAYQPRVYINLGIAFERLGKIPAAISAYERAILFQPDEPAAYYNMGILYYNILHNREKALAFLLRANELDPREPDVHQYLGKIYHDKGDSARSREEFERYHYLKH